MVQVWQVPIDRPLAFKDAQMIMVGVEQAFPAPGSLGAREDAGRAEARAEEAMASERARLIVRDADHAFTDYAEASARHRVHLAHEQIAARMTEVARARHAAGGGLSEVTQAELELARMEADVATDAARVDASRARINALTARASNAPLGAPIDEGPQVPGWPLDTLVAKAHELRPELRAAVAVKDAKGLALRAADREATWPSFRLGALYFAPTNPMPQHGYGVNASVSLPWLWGAADKRRDAERDLAASAASNVDGVRIQVDGEVLGAEAAVRSARARLVVLEARALPAAKRAFDAAWAGYEGVRADLGSLLLARRGVVDVESDIVAARAALDHALADLDAAVGGPVPRVPLVASDAGGAAAGGGHGH
jgi:outer membrane protein TolC